MYSFSYLEPVCCSMSSSLCCFLTWIQVSQRHKWRDNSTSPNLRDEVKELHTCNCVSKAVTICPGNQWAILITLSLITLCILQYQFPQSFSVLDGGHVILYHYFEVTQIKYLWISGYSTSKTLCDGQGQFRNKFLFVQSWFWKGVLQQMGMIFMSTFQCYGIPWYPILS